MAIAIANTSIIMHFPTTCNVNFPSRVSEMFSHHVSRNMQTNTVSITLIFLHLLSTGILHTLLSQPP